MRVAVHRRGVEPDLGHHLGDQLALVAPLVDLVDRKPLTDDLETGHPRAERAEGVLKDDLHVGAQPAQLLGRPFAQVLTAEGHLPFRADEPHDRQRRRGLARAAFADDAQGLARADRQAGVVDGLHMAHGPAQQALLDREPDLEVVGAQHFGRIFGHGRGRTGGLGAEQFARVGVLRIVENLRRRAFLDHQPLLHDENPVGDAPHDAEVMGDEQKPHAHLVFQILQQVEDLGLNGHVERRRRLVRDQDVGLVGQCHGDHHPLPLPPRKLVRIGIHAAFGVVDADLLEQFQHPRPRRLTLQPLMQRQRFRQLLLDRVERVERGHRLLEDEGDVVAAHVAQQLVVGADHLLAVVGDRPAHLSAFAQQRHGRQCRDRLARAAFAHQRHRLATVHGKAHPAHRRDQLPVLPEGDLQVFDVQQCSHEKVFLGSNASRMPSKMKTRSDSMMAKVKKAEKASHGA